MHRSLSLVLFLIAEYGAVPLLLSVTRRIKLIEEAGNETSLTSEVSHVIALDYHLARGEVYFSEATGQIFRTRLSPSANREEAPHIIAEVKLCDGIAVDWVHDNIYWTDFGRKTVEVAKLDGHLRQVLFNESHGLEKPRAIVVDPFKGMLFWSDWGENAKVESSGLDGKNNKTIVSSNIKWPNGLTLDLVKAKLYIMDGLLSKIISCNYDGSDFKVISTSENFLQAFGFTYYANTLYWDSWRVRSLFKMNLDNLQTETLTAQTGLQGIIERMMGLKAVHASLQQNPRTRDACSSAGCSHMCLLSDRLTHSCFCPFGYKLSGDGKTCKEEGYILLSWRRTIRRYTLDGDQDESLIDSTKAAISLGYHLEKELVFWSDIEEHRIYRAPINQLNNKTVIATPETCDGLAVDWIHDVIYWTDTDRNTIEAAQLDGSKHTVIFNTDLDQPRDIALDPFEGLMFWSDWGDVPKIERSTLDGLERKIIIDDNHIWPNGMTIDIPTKKIYYVDGKIGSIYSSSYDGTNRQILFLPPPTRSLHLFGITLLKDQLFWTDWESRTLYKSPKDDITVAQSLARSSHILLRPNGIKVVHSSLQERKENPCEKIHCQNLCLGTKHQTAHCMGEQSPPPERVDHPELVKNVFNDSVDFSFAKNITPEAVLIKVQCLGRVGCKEDFRCLNQSSQANLYKNQNSFHFANLLPGAHYHVIFISEELTDSFNITTKLNADPPEIKITSVEKQGKKVTVKWDPVDTCVPGFSSYHYSLYKPSDAIKAAREGSTNQTEVTFEDLEAEVSYKIHVYTLDSNHYSSETFNLHADVPDECKKQNLQCDGKEDCPDGRDEDVDQCAVIENVVVYKKSRSEVSFRIDVTNLSRKQLEKFVVIYNGSKSSGSEQYESAAEPCIMWPESYCLHLTSLRPNAVYDFKISAALKGGKVGAKYIVSATTKEEASGPPEDIQVFKNNATCLTYQWHHPNQSNGIIKSFIMNIVEAETFIESLCCQDFPIIERPVTDEEPFFETMTTGLYPASSYAVSIAARNMYVGMSAVVTANTPPPAMDIVRMPQVDIATLLPLSWQPADEPGDQDPKYHDLIRSYILVLLPPKSEPLSNIRPKLQDAVNEQLQSKFGKRFVVLWSKEVEDTAAFQSPIKVKSLTARKQYKLAWVQVSQYKDSYNIDVLESDPFIAI